MNSIELATATAKLENMPLSQIKILADKWSFVLENASEEVESALTELNIVILDANFQEAYLADLDTSHSKVLNGAFALVKPLDYPDLPDVLESLILAQICKVNLSPATVALFDSLLDT